MAKGSERRTGYMHALIEAGVQTRSGRGFWGGVTPSGEIVVTSWTDAQAEGGYRIWRPGTNHGGLKDRWEAGDMVVGRRVRLVVVRQQGDAVLGQGGRKVRDAVLMEGEWRISKFVDDNIGDAIVVPV